MGEQTVLNEQFYKELRKKIRNMKLQEPSYEDHRWTEENLYKYLETVNTEENQKNPGRKSFFLEETGNVLQNDLLIAAVVTYKKQGFLTKEIMDKLLSYEKPIFRVEVMRETEPRSCVFVEQIYDLLEIARENGDEQLLRYLKEYI